MTAARYWSAEVSEARLATAGSFARDAGGGEVAGWLARGQACRIDGVRGLG